MDFEDIEAYRRYLASDAHEDFAWESCAARWSEFLGADYLHEEGTPISARSPGPGSACELLLWDLQDDVTERQADQMLRALADLPRTVPEVAGLSLGRRFLPSGGGHSAVDRALLKPRGEGPLPYRRLGDAPRFGLVVECNDAVSLRRYRESAAFREFFDRYARPLWTAYRRQEMVVEEG